MANNFNTLIEPIFEGRRKTLQLSQSPVVSSWNFVLLDAIPPMKITLIVLQIIFAVLLSLSILMQSKGTGLSETFGGTSNVYSTKRGAEKVLFVATIVLSVLLVLNTLAFAFVS